MTGANHLAAGSLGHTKDSPKVLCQYHMSLVHKKSTSKKIYRANIAVRVNIENHKTEATRTATPALEKSRGVIFYVRSEETGAVLASKQFKGIVGVLKFQGVPLAPVP